MLDELVYAPSNALFNEEIGLQNLSLPDRAQLKLIEREQKPLVVSFRPLDNERFIEEQGTDEKYFTMRLSAEPQGFQKSQPFFRNGLNACSCLTQSAGKYSRR